MPKEYYEFPLSTKWGGFWKHILEWKITFQPLNDGQIETLFDFENSNTERENGTGEDGIVFVFIIFWWEKFSPIALEEDKFGSMFDREFESDPRFWADFARNLIFLRLLCL